MIKIISVLMGYVNATKKFIVRVIEQCPSGEDSDIEGGQSLLVVGLVEQVSQRHFIVETLKAGIVELMLLLTQLMLCLLYNCFIVVIEGVITS
uniref:Uncharacterized protein n=1 Tax=Glossina pallidipes TaxID=7398 RepID=A0A1B0A6R2_GLOPL